jgi:tetratricopeptide (TPR) repeat protein
MELADVAEAERCLARNRALVADLGQPALTWATMHHRATLRILHGDPDAEAAITAAHEFGVSAGGPEVAINSANHQLSLYLEQGRLGELEELMHQVLDRTQHPVMKLGYAYILTETGEMEAAAALFDELAATRFAHPTNNVAWLVFAALCAWLCARLGRDDCVPLLRSRLEPYADQLVVTGFAGWVSGPVALYLGLLSTTIGDWPEAEGCFAAAAATQERIGAPTLLARTRLEWARMLLLRADPGDGERAHDLLRQALVTARELSLANLERRAIELLSSQ